MKKIGEIIEKHIKKDTVNSKEKYLNTVNSNTVNDEDSLITKIKKAIEEENITPDGIGLYLSELLEDKKSVAYFKLLAKENNNAKLLEAAALTKEAYEAGEIRINKSVYFLGILRDWGMKTKFKDR